METMKIGGRAVPIVGYVPLEGTGDTVPLADIPMVSDYKWQQQSLQCRLDHPEWYAAIGEDVGATIARLRRWLEEHNEESAPNPAVIPTTDRKDGINGNYQKARGPERPQLSNTCILWV